MYMNIAVTSCQFFFAACVFVARGAEAQFEIGIFSDH